MSPLFPNPLFTNPPKPPGPPTLLDGLSMALLIIGVFWLLIGDG